MFVYMYKRFCFFAITQKRHHLQKPVFLSLRLTFWVYSFENTRRETHLTHLTFWTVHWKSLSLSDMFWDCHSDHSHWEWRRMWKSTSWPAADTSTMPRHNCRKYRIVFWQIQNYVFDKYKTSNLANTIAMFLLLFGEIIRSNTSDWKEAVEKVLK